MRGDEIEHEIKKLRTIRSEAGKGAKPIIFSEVDAVFQNIEEGTRLSLVNDACGRFERCCTRRSEVLRPIEMTERKHM